MFLLLLLISFIAGVLTFQHSTNFNPILFDKIPAFLILFVFGIIFFSALKLFYKFYKVNYLKWALVIITLFLSFSCGHLYSHNLSSIRLQNLLSPELSGQEFEFEVYVANIPQNRQSPSYKGYRYEVEVINPPKNFVGNFPKKLRLTEYIRNSEVIPSPLTAGSYWQVRARLYALHGHYSPYAFDYEGWLFKRGFGATGAIKSRISQTKAAAFSLVNLRQYLLNRLQIFEKQVQKNKPDFIIPQVVPVLGLGVQAGLDSDKWRILRQSGTIHLFSISGIHITLLAILFASLTAWLWRRSLFLPSLKFSHINNYISTQRAAMIVALICAWLYAAISGFNYPAQRTVIMLSVAILIKIFGLRSPWFNSAILALFTICIIDPWAVLFEGLWLSFAGVCLLLIFSDRMITNFDNNIDESNFWKIVLHIINLIGKFAIKFIHIQIVFSIVLIPLLILFFNQLPTVGVIANLIAMPIISWIVVPLAIILIFFPVRFGFTFLANIQDWFFQIMEFLISFMPAISLPQPSSIALFMAAIGIIYFIMPKGFINKWLIGLFLLPILTAQTPAPVFGNAKVYVNDVGSGLSVLVRTKNHNLLFDTGAKTNNYSAFEFVVKPLMQAQGIKSLDKLILSHADNDHAGGFEQIIEKFNVDELIVGDRKSAWDNRFENISQKLIPKHCSPKIKKWQWDGVEFSIVRAEYKSSNKKAVLNKKSKAVHENNSSCVLKIKSEKSILITSDVENFAMKNLTKKHPDFLVSDYLLAPHHGSNSSHYKKFYQFVNPKYFILSAGYRQRFYPASKVRKSLQSLSTIPEIYHTWYDGTLIINLDNKQKLQAYRETNQKYWHSYVLAKIDYKFNLIQLWQLLMNNNF